MSDKLTVGPRSDGRLLNRPPADQAWVWQSRALRQSDAWRSAGINARRFVDFLLIEHMKQGGRANGLLKATQRQLIAFGIGARYVTKAIREAEKLGLVDGYHGGRRVATKYALTWLSRVRWDSSSGPMAGLSQPRSQASAGAKIERAALQREGKAALQREGRPHQSAHQREGRCGNLPADGKAESALPWEGAFYRFLPGRGCLLCLRR
jgi:hypothetical protein